jgi:putative ABC transport system permease protein
MITIIKLVLARYLHKPGSTLLSILLFAIGVAVILLVMKSEWYLENKYKKNLANIDLVVGAKGSPLQLILSSVFHADMPTGNIPLDEVEKIKKNPMVKKTIPLALGDNYKGYRIVGTNPDYPELYNAELLQGSMFSNPLDAVIGANVAKETGLKLKDNFTGVHGFISEGHSHDEFKYTVTGVLKPTATIIDDLILTPVETVWSVHSHQEDHHHEEGMHDHDHHSHEDSHDHDHHSEGDTHNHDHHGEEPHDHNHHKHDHEESTDEHLHEDHSHDHAHDHETHTEEDQHDETIDAIFQKIDQDEELSEDEVRIYNKHKGILTDKKQDPENEITALLVFYQNPMGAAMLPRMINENTTLQAASPAFEFDRLLNLLGYGIQLLQVLAWLIILISGINIFIYLLNSINQSIREIALLRATGVSRPKVFIMILTQGALLAVFGWLLGILLSLIIWQFLPFPDTANVFTSVLIQNNLLLLLYCVFVALFAAVIPAIKVYKNKIHYLLSR